MRKINVQQTALSVFAGMTLALVIVLSAWGLTQSVSADDYCVPPQGCATLGCFTNGAGQKSCKNYNLQGGPWASNECATGPGSGGGGGIILE
jgi:hypothetical protein